MWCDDVSLRPVRLNPHYFLYRNILLGFGIILAVTFIIIFKVWKDGGWVLLFVVVAIIAGVFCSENYLKIIATNLAIEVIVLRKFSHLFFFLVLAVVSSLWLRNRLRAFGSYVMSLPYTILLFTGLSFFAAITEFLQLVTIDRTPTFLDWLIDMTGILMGISLTYFIKKT